MTWGIRLERRGGGPALRAGLLAARAAALGFAAVFAAGASACATVNTSGAARLAADGAEVARTSQAALAATRPGLERYVEGLYLVAPLTGRAPPSGPLLASIDRVGAAMAARAQVMAELARAYGSFAALAGYGGQDSVGTGLGALTGAINAYAARVTPGAAPFTPLGTGLLGAAGREVTGRAQARMLDASSRALRERVERVRDVMRREITLRAAIEEELVAGARNNVRALYRLHLLTPEALLAGQFDDYGLALDSARVAQYATGPTAKQGGVSLKQRAALDSAVLAVVDRRARRRLEAQRSLVEAGVGSLDALVEAHRTFERGAPLASGAIAEQLAIMHRYVEQLQPSSSTPAPSGGSKAP